MSPFVGGDHFSGHAADYAKHRPGYPAALFDWLAAESRGHDLAWDAGTGSGQAAVALAERFGRIVATDLSEPQIAHARPHPKVEYRVAPAEASGLADASCDLVAVAQALHWFDFGRFFAEAERVLKPGGLFAAWTYTLVQGDPALNAAMRDFHDNVVGPYWPPERKWVDLGYRGIALPFAVLPAPTFRICLEWTRADLIDYLSTWSATRRCCAASGRDPTATFDARIAGFWPAGETRALTWPLALLAGRTR